MSTIDAIILAMQKTARAHDNNALADLAAILKVARDAGELTPHALSEILRRADARSELQPELHNMLAIKCDHGVYRGYFYCRVCNTPTLKSRPIPATVNSIRATKPRLIRGENVLPETAAATLRQGSFARWWLRPFTGGTQPIGREMAPIRAARRDLVAASIREPKKERRNPTWHLPVTPAVSHKASAERQFYDLGMQIPSNGNSHSALGLTCVPREDDLAAVDAIRNAIATFEVSADSVSDLLDRDVWLLGSLRLRAVLAGLTGLDFRKGIGLSERYLNWLDGVVALHYSGSLYPRMANGIIMSTPRVPGQHPQAVVKAAIKRVRDQRKANKRKMSESAPKYMGKEETQLA